MPSRQRTSKKIMVDNERVMDCLNTLDGQSYVSFGEASIESDDVLSGFVIATVRILQDDGFRVDPFTR